MPPTVGFVSKWYLVLGTLEQGLWPVAVLILVGSLLALLYIWKLVEAAYFDVPPDAAPMAVREAPLSMLIPVWVLVAANVYFGLHTELSVGVARQAAVTLLHDRDLWACHSDAARTWAATFSWDRCVSESLELFARVAATRKTAP